MRASEQLTYQKFDLAYMGIVQEGLLVESAQKALNE